MTRASMWILCGALAGGVFFASDFVRGAAAQDLVKIEEVVTGLDNPVAIAVQPESGALYVSEVGKVIRVDPKDNHKTEDAITGFAKDVYGKGPMYDIGPLGLVFMDKNTLIVGGGDKPDDQEVVYVFDAPEKGKSKKAEEAKQKLGPLGKTPEGAQAEGNYYGLAIGKSADKTALFVTCNGDDTKGWVARALYNEKDKKFEDFKRFIATKEETKVDAPVAIMMSSKGYVLVGQMGEINVPKDSLLTWYDSKEGKRVMNLKTNLHDITGLAYSPKTGNMYATDFAWMETKDGGLFRIEDDKKKQDAPDKGVTLTKFTGLDKPTAMTFTADGTLYVTVLGTAKDGDAKKPGKLLKITSKGSDPL